MQSGVYDAFAEKLSAALADRKVGDGLEEGTDFGPLIEPSAVVKVEEHIADAKAKGATVLTGGNRHHAGPLFFEPTIVTGATQEMAFATDETFGPLAPLFRFETEEEVIGYANDTVFGLASYFYARDYARIIRVEEALEYGIGLGNFGGTVARELMRFGNDVIGVDKDEAKVQALADDLSEALIADAQNEDALKDCGVADARGVLISCGHDISASILAAMNVKLLGVDRIWVKADSNMHHRVLTRLGVDRVVRPDQEAGRQVAHGLHNPLVRDFVSLGNGLHLVNATVPETLEGKPLGELDLEESFELRCLGVSVGLLGFENLCQNERSGF